MTTVLLHAFAVPLAMMRCCARLTRLSISAFDDPAAPDVAQVLILSLACVATDPAGTKAAGNRGHAEPIMPEALL